jgi:hypothetical protein
MASETNGIDGVEQESANKQSVSHEAQTKIFDADKTNVATESNSSDSHKKETNVTQSTEKLSDKFVNVAKATKAPKAAKAVASVLTPVKPATRVKRARLRVTRIDPLSMLRTSFLFAMSASIVIFIVIVIIWAVLSVSGALESIQKILDSVVGSGSGSGSMQLSKYLETWRVLGFSALISVINVVLLTLIGTVVAYIYNLAASIYGGIEITLAEDTH